MKEAQQVLINNLKKQLSEKREYYSDMIYQYAIQKVLNEKYPIDEDSMIDVEYLPIVSNLRKSNLYSSIYNVYDTN